MSTTLNLPHSQDEQSWKISISIAFAFYVLLIAFGFSSKSDALLDLIAQGETIGITASDPLRVEQQEIEIDLAPPPPPEANPDFVKPEEVVKPKLAEIPKPRPKPIVTSDPAPVQNNAFAASNIIVGNKNFPKPPYPIEAKMKRFQGTVILSISVSNGSIQSVSVTSSSGYGILDAEARRWVQSRWKFPEGLSRDFQQPLRFELNS